MNVTVLYGHLLKTLRMEVWKRIQGSAGDCSAPAGAVFEGVMRRSRDVQWHQDLAPKW